MCKYYIPTIDEFHLDFEYQVFEDSDSVEKTGWIDQTFGREEWAEEDLEYIEKNELTRIRVKYLDKKDIESLGWKYEDIYRNGGTELYTLSLFKLSFDAPNKLFSKAERCLRVTINSDEERNGLRIEKTLFRGNIKNKTELKRVMQQVGILENA